MKNKICNISLFSAVLACVAGVPVSAFSASWVDARTQRSYANAYNQVETVRNQQEYLETVVAQDIPVVQTASATQTLPVEVEDKNLAARILQGDPTAPSIADLERCAMTDIRGVFKWGIPKSGARKNSKPQCVAVVNLIDSSQQVLATTTVATGDAITCNIDEFPEEGYTPALATVELPADAAPTLKDVEKVLNKEQKQNAGIKIAAAAIVGGLAGNMLGPKKNGDEKLLGTGKMQLATTAAGVAGAAGIMAASSYSGKVVGDTIKSTAISATAGMMAGNMAAGLMGSNSVMATTTCTVQENGVSSEHDCVIGRYYIKGDGLNTEENNWWTDKNAGTVYKCNKNNADCKVEHIQIINITLEDNQAKKLDEYDQNDYVEIEKSAQCINSSDKKMEKCDSGSEEKRFYLIHDATTTKKSEPGYAVFSNLPHKAFGYKISDWDKLKTQNPTYYRRSTNTGIASNREDSDKVEFVPSARSAQDGSIIDLSNEARAKGTLIGTAAGGALGGFTGYQGAQNEITERWLAAMAEYEGYLSNFSCVTGDRFLYIYNGYAGIPAMRSADNETETTTE